MFWSMNWIVRWEHMTSILFHYNMLQYSCLLLAPFCFDSYTVPDRVSAFFFCLPAASFNPFSEHSQFTPSSFHLTKLTGIEWTKWQIALLLFFLLSEAVWSFAVLLQYVYIGNKYERNASHMNWMQLYHPPLPLGIKILYHSIYHRIAIWSLSGFFLASSSSVINPFLQSFSID